MPWSLIPALAVHYMENKMPSQFHTYGDIGSKTNVQADMKFLENDIPMYQSGVCATESGWECSSCKGDNPATAPRCTWCRKHKMVLATPTQKQMNEARNQEHRLVTEMYLKQLELSRQYLDSVECIAREPKKEQRT